ncbi:MAG: hypothetical protein J5753_00510 [Oscillospiraceae bacterium]|nr:hypothetical protein [Oscillospiraceae bacterium]
MKWIPKKGCLFVCAVQLLLGGCGILGSEPDNMPYEPDTPAPAAHDGVFTSEHGSMRFNGDGTSLETDFDAELAALTGLPEGAQTGSYVFLSGDLPPHGSMPVRYDTAHEMQINVNEISVVIDMGIASEDGKTAQVGVDIVTPERIPMLFRQDGRSFDVMFIKDEHSESE